jgi:hypothetical protein
MATDTMRGTPGSIRQAPRRPAPTRAPRAYEPGRQVTAPRHTRPVARPPAAAPRTTARPRTRPARMPFILLLVGLLGGALISLLVISTTLAQGSFRVTHLQQQNANLARQEQSLTSEVAQASNPAVIAQEAAKLGMVQNPNLKFVNLKTGKIVAGKPTKADKEINVPGYNP